MNYQVELTSGAEEDLERLSLTMARRIARILDRLERENVPGFLVISDEEEVR